MTDREKVIKGLGIVSRMLNEMGRRNEMDIVDDALAMLKEDCHNCKLKCLLQKYDELKEKYDKLLKEQDELLKHEYWRGYNNGRADERGLQEGTIMQTFSPD